MKIQTIDGELWWLANGDEIRSPRSFSLRETLDLIRESFGFFAWPLAIPSGNEGYSFQHGSLRTDKDVVVIRQLVLYNAGIHVSVAGSTDGADLVFEKVAEIFRGLGVREPVTPPVKFYRSNITCDFERSLETLFAQYQSISSILRGKGCLPEKPMHESGIAFSADPTTLPANLASINPTIFTVNRKIDVNFAMNRYACFANMRTVEHLDALAQIERLL
jgi:hypothetical protein